MNETFRAVSGWPSQTAPSTIRSQSTAPSDFTGAGGCFATPRERRLIRTVKATLLESLSAKAERQKRKDMNPASGNRAGMGLIGWGVSEGKPGGAGDTVVKAAFVP